MNEIPVRLRDRTRAIKAFGKRGVFFTRELSWLQQICSNIIPFPTHNITPVPRTSASFPSQDGAQSSDVCIRMLRCRYQRYKNESLC